MADAFDLAPQPPRPRLPGSVIVRESVDELVDAVAADILVHAANCVRAFGDFHLALSGGSTPLPVYRRMMYDPNIRDFPWGRTHVWVVDERRVPFDDDRSNFKMINELIGDHSGIPPEQLHPIFALADDADVQYENLLRQVLAWREPGHDRLDYVLLGMGADGHTASLFPYSPALRDEDPEPGQQARLVKINAGPTVTPPERVTMTYRLLNASRFVGVMVTGAAKRATVAKVAAAARSAPPNAGALGGLVEQLPILGIQPVGGELRWYLDYDACPEGAPSAATPA
jgi:6-phosphogluconolactonase